VANVTGEATSDRFHQCPHCGSDLVRRDHRKGLFERWALRLLGTRPYHCVECGRRFWDRPLGDDSSYID